MPARVMLCLVLLSLVNGSILTAQAADTELDGQLDAGRQALADERFDAALAAGEQAVKLAPTDPRGYLLRMTAHDKQGSLAAAIGDCDALLKLEAIAASKSASANLHDLRGSLEFKQGKIAESIRDFDQAIALEPAREPGHWKRGISYYYAGRFAEGQRQFEGYQTVDNADVENVVWRYLCMAKVVGMAEARVKMLPVGQDRRVPLMEIYALFTGKAQPEDVLKAVEAGAPTGKEFRTRSFYAHLYLGLWYDADGDTTKAREHMELAVKKFLLPDYMGDVARVHLDILERGAKPAAKP